MTTQPIKTRPDGSIDTGFYIRRGRHLRSRAAHEMFGQGTRNPARGATRRWVHDMLHRAFLW